MKPESASETLAEKFYNYMPYEIWQEFATKWKSPQIKADNVSVFRYSGFAP